MTSNERPVLYIGSDADSVSLENLWDTTLWISETASAIKILCDTLIGRSNIVEAADLGLVHLIGEGALSIERVVDRIQPHDRDRSGVGDS